MCLNICFKSYYLENKKVFLTVCPGQHTIYANTDLSVCAHCWALKVLQMDSERFRNKDTINHLILSLKSPWNIYI